MRDFVVNWKHFVDKLSENKINSVALVSGDSMLRVLVYQTGAQLSQRDSAMLRVNEYLTKSLKGTLRRRLTYIFFSFNKKFNI